MGKASKRPSTGTKSKASAAVADAPAAATADDEPLGTSLKGFLMRQGPRFLRILGTMFIMHYFMTWARAQKE
jgi:hypothetical protein